MITYDAKLHAESIKAINEWNDKLDEVSHDKADTEHRQRMLDHAKVIQERIEEDARKARSLNQWPTARPNPLE